MDKVSGRMAEKCHPSYLSEEVLGSIMPQLGFTESLVKTIGRRCKTTAYSKHIEARGCGANRSDWVDFRVKEGNSWE